MCKMNNVAYIFVIILSVTVVTWSSPAEQCPGEHFDDLPNRIDVKPCGKTKCNLPKEQNTTVTFKFIPEKVVNTLRNKVWATIGIIDLPFIGVDGLDACGSVHHADDGTPAQCPLKANVEYVYVHTFYVEPVYPKIAQMRVHWSLNDGDAVVICFEVKAAIVKNKHNR